MISTIEQYLAMLKKELAGSDRATVQDALSDAEEYLRTAQSSSSSNDAPTLDAIISEYGTPQEVAAAYKRAELHPSPVPSLVQAVETETSEARAAVKDNRPFYTRFWTVFSEPQAWGALLYSLLALPTGIFYFTWAVTGISVSAGLLVLIVGLPIAGLFLLSVRGIALMEGRLVEALLNVRMPRRARYYEKKVSIRQRFKNMVADEHTWFSVIYMIIHMPLGVLYFSVTISLIATSLWIVVWPVLSVAFGEPVIIASSTYYYATGWLIPISVVVGALLLTATMHLAKAIGKGHGALAKALLVRP